MSDIQITVGGGKLRLSAPYNKDFPAMAREIGGRFDRATKEWMFDARDEARVRELCRSVYGTDGAPEPMVDVRIHMDTYVDGQELWICGRQVARRPGRDAPVRLGDGVVIIEGGFPEGGGSRGNPALSPFTGTVLEMRDVPAGHPHLDNDPDLEVVRKGEVDRDALQGERARLKARLAEIREALGE